MNATSVQTLTPEDRARRVIKLVAEGKPVTYAVRAEGLSMSTFHETISGARELGAAYARAQELRADVLVEEAIEAADSDEDPAKVRNKMTIRQWAASKYHSKRYGERIDVNVQQNISINDALSEARARLVLRPMSDQQDVIDVETRELPSVTPHGPTDKQSVSDAPDPEPDIFG